MKNHYKNYFINLMFPAFILGACSGIFTSLVVLLYKLCAKYIIGFSEKFYHYLGDNLSVLPIVICALFVVAFLFAYLYKHVSNLRGGGIPASIGFLRGILPFKWVRNIFGVFILSLIHFFIGVPLGNEGPSVQMGTAIGRGCVYTFAKKNRAWDRYSMTGGACAGFAVATGAPISGIIFAIEEAHQRISPMIIIVASASVMFSHLTAELLSPLLGVSLSLFPKMELIKLSAVDIWIPIVVGLVIGLFAVLFLNYYKVINTFVNKILKKIPLSLKIFTVYLATLILGIVSYSFISTGHELILELFHGEIAIIMLAVILLVRSTVTLSANTSGLTGGIFLPILALGAVLSSILGKLGQLAFGIGHEYYVMILVFGIIACVSGMMKMPLTAIIFAVEALSCHDNILFVITASAVAFVITEIFETKSINDTVLYRKIDEMHEGKTPTLIDARVTVKEGAFAIGKQTRDIFWPSNLFVLSVKHSETLKTVVDGHGGKEIMAGDVLHIRYSTYDEEQTLEELVAIVGEQKLKDPKKTRIS